MVHLFLDRGVVRLPKVSEEHKEQRKHQILTASMGVFKRKGYEKATLKDIVEEAGMSRGWIYLYFTDKIEIFEALLLSLDVQLDEVIFVTEIGVHVCSKHSKGVFRKLCWILVFCYNK